MGIIDYTPLLVIAFIVIASLKAFFNLCSKPRITIKPLINHSNFIGSKTSIGFSSTSILNSQPDVGGKNIMNIRAQALFKMMKNKTNANSSLEQSQEHADEDKMPLAKNNISGHQSPKKLTNNKSTKCNKSIFHQESCNLLSPISESKNKGKLVFTQSNQQLSTIVASNKRAQNIEQIPNAHIELHSKHSLESITIISHKPTHQLQQINYCSFSKIANFKYLTINSLSASRMASYMSGQAIFSNNSSINVKRFYI